MNLARYNCNTCGEEFEAACLSELQEKKAKHKCAKINKRVERTKQLQEALVEQFVDDTAVNRLEQHNFEKLIRTGMIVSA